MEAKDSFIFNSLYESVMDLNPDLKEEMFYRLKHWMGSNDVESYKLNYYALCSGTEFNDEYSGDWVEPCLWVSKESLYHFAEGYMRGTGFAWEAIWESTCFVIRMLRVRFLSSAPVVIALFV